MLVTKCGWHHRRKSFACWLTIYVQWWQSHQIHCEMKSCKWIVVLKTGLSYKCFVLLHLMSKSPHMQWYIYIYIYIYIYVCVCVWLYVRAFALGVNYIYIYNLSCDNSFTTQNLWFFRRQNFKGFEALQFSMSATMTQLLSSGEFCKLRYDTIPVKSASANVSFLYQ